MARTQVPGSQIADGANGVNLTVDVTGVLPVANGGTGASSIPTWNQNTTGTASNVTGTVAVANGGTGNTTNTLGSLLVGNGTGAVTGIAPGTSGNLLTSNGSAWSSQPLSLTVIPWCPEMVCTSAAVADGYNDMPGGISVEPGINSNGVYLDAVWLRVGDLATSNSGGDLVCDVYGGTKSTQGTLIVSITLTNGSQDVVSTLGSPYSLAANAVVRAYFTKGSSTVAKPLHVQLRGRYKG